MKESVLFIVAREAEWIAASVIEFSKVSNLHKIGEFVFGQNRLKKRQVSWCADEQGGIPRVCALNDWRANHYIREKHC